MSKTRQQLIGETADLTDREGNGVGIFGTAVCQVCGRAGSFGGWAGAMASHRHGIFIPVSHGHTEGEVQSALTSDAPRFCSVCAQQVSGHQSEDKHGSGFSCERCSSLSLSRSQIARRRFLDERHGSISELRQRLERAEETAALRGTSPSSELARVRLSVARMLRKVSA